MNVRTYCTSGESQLTARVSESGIDGKHPIALVVPLYWNPVPIGKYPIVPANRAEDKGGQNALARSHRNMPPLDSLHPRLVMSIASAIRISLL